MFVLSAHIWNINVGLYLDFTYYYTTGCPQKNLRLLWKAISPLRIFVVIKVRGDSGSTVAEISVEYHNFPVAQQGAEIFEFKVDPVP